MLDEKSGARRQVTLVFCDLVGSSEIAGRLDPEVFHEILLAYHRTAAEIVARYDGSIGKFMGDGLLAHFGHPRAHEDDARRAILAGLDLVEAVSHLGEAMATTHGVNLAARVGIHTGLVVVGELGAGEHRQADDVIGANTILAYRIQAAADPNSVLVSAATHDLVRGYFVVSMVGRRELHGISRPVELYRVVRPSGAESRLEAVRRRSPLVGRDTECAALVEAWRRAQAGDPSAILIEGEPGIGKSRLVEHLSRHVLGTGGLSVTLQCSAYHVNTLLHPVARLLRQRASPDNDVDATWNRLRLFVETVGPAPADDLYLLASFADIRLPSSIEAPVLTAERRREQLIRALMDWVGRASAVVPFLLVVEDLHWADPSTLEVLERLVDRAARGSLLMVFTSRPGHDYKADLSALRLMRLQPITAGERETLVAELTREAPVSRAVSRRIAERSDGIPLYIEELARMLSGREDAQGPDGREPATDIPTSLHDLLTARLDQFPAQKHLAQLVATVGPAAPLSLLALLLATGEADLVGQLRPLIEGGLLLVEGGTCSFGHALLRDAAYQSQLRSNRRDLHRRVARALVQHFPEMCEIQPELLAEHCFESEQYLLAAAAWQRAGQRMAYRGAHTEATAYFHQALAAVASVPVEEESAQLELSLQDSLGLSLLALQGYTSAHAEKAYSRALELTSSVRRNPAATTQFGLWAYWVVRGDQGKAMTLAREALASAQATGGRARILHSCCLLGYSEFYVGNFEAASELLAKGSEYDFPPGEITLPHHPAVVSLVNLAPTLWVLGQPRRARAVLTKGLDMAERLGPPWGPFTRAYACTFAAWWHELVGDPGAAIPYATRAVEISGEHGFPTWLSAGSLHLAIAQSMAGAPLESIGAIDAGLRMWRAAGAELFVTYYLYGLALGRRDAGDLVGARRAVDEAIACVDEHGERFYEAELHRLRGELLLAGEGSEEEAVAALRKAVRTARAQGAVTFEVRALTSLHRCARSAADRAQTEMLLERALASLVPEDDMPELVRARAALAAKVA